MEIAAVNIHQAQVSLGQASQVKIHFEGLEIPPNGPPLHLAQGIHMIRFQIEPSEPEGVMFPSSPILWMRADRTTMEELPPGLLVRWQNPREFSVVIFNAVGTGHTSHFRLVVSSGDQVVVSHDPTIVCDPPGTTPVC